MIKLILLATFVAQLANAQEYYLNASKPVSRISAAKALAHGSRTVVRCTPMVLVVHGEPIPEREYQNRGKLQNRGMSARYMPSVTR